MIPCWNYLKMLNCCEWCEGSWPDQCWDFQDFLWSQIWAGTCPEGLHCKDINDNIKTKQGSCFQILWISHKIHDNSNTILNFYIIFKKMKINLSSTFNKVTAIRKPCFQSVQWMNRWGILSLNNFLDWNLHLNLNPAVQGF